MAIMSNLSVTLIDVGWGDSILIESQDSNRNYSYALIDSNDSTYLRSSYIFLKRYFEKRGIKLPDDKPVFDFVLLSHAHSDHGQGLKAVMRAYGTKNFWYPKSKNWSSLADLIRFANRSNNVQHHQSVDSTKVLHRIGDVDMEILWPLRDQIDANENNNSVVLVLKLNDISLVLTGDAEVDVWNQISNQLPRNTRFFKIPHHGSINGTFDNNDETPWFDNCSQEARLGISSHVRPFNHPDQRVIQLLDDDDRQYFRTDEHYHITFQTDGNQIEVKYSHI